MFLVVTDPSLALAEERVVDEQRRRAVVEVRGVDDLAFAGDGLVHAVAEDLLHGAVPDDSGGNGGFAADADEGLRLLADLGLDGPQVAAGLLGLLQRDAEFLNLALDGLVAQVLLQVGGAAGLRDVDAENVLSSPHSMATGVSASAAGGSAGAAAAAAALGDDFAAEDARVVMVTT